MKKVLIATLAIGMMAGCEEPPTTTLPTQHKVKIGVDVDRSAMFTHKGNCKNPRRPK